MKVHEDIDLASALATHLAEAFASSWPVDLIIPIPLSATRFHLRGFNQAELLAKAFAHFVKLPIAIKGLVRIRDTEFQRTLGRTEREQNVKRAFEADRGSFAGMKILVVDDVFVTGATINSASKAIKRAGGESVFAVTVARSLLNRSV